MGNFQFVSFQIPQAQKQMLCVSKKKGQNNPLMAVIKSCAVEGNYYVNENNKGERVRNVYFFDFSSCDQQFSKMKRNVPELVVPPTGKSFT